MNITAGLRINKFTVIKIINNEKYNYRRGNQWECKCDCGNIVVIEQGRLKKGVKGCRNCATKGRQNLWIRKKYGECSKNGLINRYKGNAKAKNLEFSLSEEELVKLFKGNCHYCGQIPNKIFKPKGAYGEYVYNGIDRKNSNKGYISNNVVSCCWNCNYMKGNKEEKEFIEISKLINNVLQSKITDYEI